MHFINTKSAIKIAVPIVMLQITCIYVRFEVFTEVAMKNAFFWDIKNQFVSHRKHIRSPLQSPAG
jgi:hypothetical protein